MFDVLYYLYENYHHPDACPPRALLLKKLAAVGFDSDEVSDALSWLERLDHAAAMVEVHAAQDDEATTQTPASTPTLPAGFTLTSLNAGTGSLAQVRVYSPEEKETLGEQALAFLHMLEANHAIDVPLRELAISSSLACDERPLTLEDFKLVLLMAFWRLGREPDDLLFDELCFEDYERTLH